jgi:hypothetical protein
MFLPAVRAYVLSQTLMMRAGELDRQQGCWNPALFDARSFLSEAAARKFM